MFSKLHDTKLVLSRSAFFVNQVTSLWAPATLIGLVELGQQRFSVECECLLFLMLFSTKFTDEGPFIILVKLPVLKIAVDLMFLPFLQKLFSSS